MLEKKASLVASIKENMHMTSGAHAKVRHLALMTFGQKRNFLKDLKKYTTNNNVSVYEALEVLGSPGDKLHSFPEVYL
jgi:hypothetical protein